MKVFFAIFAVNVFGSGGKLLLEIITVVAQSCHRLVELEIRPL
jgi:hypothetical protein